MKNKSNILKVLSLFFLFILSTIFFPKQIIAQEETEEITAKIDKKLLEDYSESLSIENKENLSQKLQDYYQATGIKIYAVLISNRGAKSLLDISREIARERNILPENQDSIALVLVTMDEKQAFLKLSGGLRPNFANDDIKNILLNATQPELAQGKYYLVLEFLSNLLIRRLSPDYVLPENANIERKATNNDSLTQLEEQVQDSKENESKSWSWGYIILPIALLLVIGFILMSYFEKKLDVSVAEMTFDALGKIAGKDEEITPFDVRTFRGGGVIGEW